MDAVHSKTNTYLLFSNRPGRGGQTEDEDGKYFHHFDFLSSFFLFSRLSRRRRGVAGGFVFGVGGDALVESLLLELLQQGRTGRWWVLEREEKMKDRWHAFRRLYIWHREGRVVGRGETTTSPTAAPHPSHSACRGQESRCSWGWRCWR